MEAGFVSLELALRHPLAANCESCRTAFEGSSGNCRDAPHANGALCRAHLVSQLHKASLSGDVTRSWPSLQDFRSFHSFTVLYIYLDIDKYVQRLVGTGINRHRDSKHRLVGTDWWV